jgi:hypothetical protein
VRVVPVPTCLSSRCLTRGSTLRPVSARERTITIVLVAAAIAAWFATAFVLAFVSPERNAGGQLLGAIVFGLTAALTLWPLMWSLVRSNPDALSTSGRRAFLAGSVVTVLVILRAIDVVSPIVVVFVIVAAVVIELAFRLRRD